MKLKRTCVVDYPFSEPYCRLSILSIIDFISQSAMNRSDILAKGPVIIYGGGWHRREMFFVGKIFLTQPLKSQKFDYPTSNIN